MRGLKIVTIFPDDCYFTFQSHLWLESLKERNLIDKAIVLIFTPNDREQNKERFQQIIDLYPEAEFDFYKDEHNISQYLRRYIPILRPYTAWRYWTDHPEMKEKAVFYCDSDILFLEGFNLDPFLDDDIIYCSDTNSYINADYFNSKVRDVLPNKLEEYQSLDILDTAARMIGINRKICEKNNLHSGGTQYLLKNIDADYWFKIMNECIPLKNYLEGINREFFESENKGYQSWVTDMFLVLWNLWLRGQETKIVKELDFSWATDGIDRLKTTTIFHNAGISSDMQDGHPCFFKGKYHQGTDPTKDPHLDVILNNELSKKSCTWFYANKLKELSNKYHLNYS